MPAFPHRGTRIVLRGRTGATYPGKAIAVSSGRLAFELDNDHDRAFMPDERILVTWTDTDGVITVPAKVVDVPLYEDRAWLVETAGDAWNEQRRQYFRAPLAGSVALRRPDSFDIAVGDLIDLSEAGLRCRIGERHRPLAEPGTELVVSVVLGEDEDFQLPGKVLYGRHASRPDGGLEFVVLFDRPVVQVERLRFHIRQAELRSKPALA